MVGQLQHFFVIMRLIERLLLLTGFICLGLYGFYTVQAKWHQAELERVFEEDRTYEPSPAPSPSPSKPLYLDPSKDLKEGDLVGRLEVPRLDMTVMVIEGTKPKTLRLGAGHIKGTAYPGTKGNAGIAAHRDTYFRNLRNIKEDDIIRFSTPKGSVEYRVATTKIVNPRDVEVLDPTTDDMLTLVTCYPFFYVGSAPKRFIVQAVRAD